MWFTVDGMNGVYKFPQTTRLLLHFAGEEEASSGHDLLKSSQTQILLIPVDHESKRVCKKRNEKDLHVHSDGIS